MQKHPGTHSLGSRLRRFPWDLHVSAIASPHVLYSSKTLHDLNVSKSSLLIAKKKD